MKKIGSKNKVFKVGDIVQHKNREYRHIVFIIKEVLPVPETEGKHHYKCKRFDDKKTFFTYNENELIAAPEEIVSQITQKSVKGIFAPKYNLFKVGDAVCHKDDLYHSFKITEILINVPEIKGEYLYKCRIVQGIGDRRKIYIYHERDLVLAEK